MYEKVFWVFMLSYSTKGYQVFLWSFEDCALHLSGMTYSPTEENSKISNVTWWKVEVAPDIRVRFREWNSSTSTFL